MDLLFKSSDIISKTCFNGFIRSHDDQLYRVLVTKPLDAPNLKVSSAPYCFGILNFLLNSQIHSPVHSNYLYHKFKVLKGSYCVIIQVSHSS